MAENWTSSELALVIAAKHGDGGFGARLQAALRDAVRDRRLGPGDVLPSSRAFAAELSVARGTIVQAYEQLVAEGYLVAAAGSKTRVSATATATDAPAMRTRREPRLRARHDLRPGVPDLRSFPARDWSWALGEAARRVRPVDLDYGDGRGHPAALDGVAAHLRRARGAAVGPEAIVMGTGFAQCVSLAIGVLAARGIRSIAVEDPGDRSIDNVATAAGMRVVAVPVDDAGIDVDGLAATGARAVVVTPAHQAPTGAVLSPARRAALVEWAERVDGYVIEDDYDSEFRYDRQPIGAVQGLAPHRVLLIGSASKTHAPGLRLAWMTAPGPLLDELSAAKRASDRGGSVIDQYAFALLIESGRHDRHVRSMRGVYSARRRVLVEMLAQFCPRLALTGLEAGFHGVLSLPSGVSEERAIGAAAEQSIELIGLAASTLERTDLGPALVIGFGNADAESISEAVAALAPVLRGVSDAVVRDSPTPR